MYTCPCGTGVVCPWPSSRGRSWPPPGPGQRPDLAVLGVGENPEAPIVRAPPGARGPQHLLFQALLECLQGWEALLLSKQPPFGPWNGPDTPPPQVPFARAPGSSSLSAARLSEAHRVPPSSLQSADRSQELSRFSVSLCRLPPRPSGCVCHPPAASVLGESPARRRSR